MTQRPRSQALVAGLVLVLVGSLWLARASRQDAALDMAASPGFESKAAPESATRGGREARTSRPESMPGQSDTRPASMATALRIAGTLHWRPSGRPVERATLRLAPSVNWRPATGSAPTAVECGVADGRFALAMPADTWQLGFPCEIEWREGGTRLLTVRAALEPEIHLLVDEPVDLAGIVVDAGGTPLPGCALRFDLPVTSGEAAPIFAGSARTGSDGRFACRVYPDRVMASFLVSIGTRELACVRPVPAAELRARDGARIALDLVELRLRVLGTESDAPLAKATLHLREPGKDGALTRLETDADGRAQVRLEPQDLVCEALLPEHAAAHVAWRAQDLRSPVEREIRLAPLTAADEITGTVLDPAHAPCAGQRMVVTLVDPAAPERTGWAVGSARTAADGTFRVRAQANAPLALRAFHAHYGTALLELPPGAPRAGCVLQFQAGGELQVEWSGGSFGSAIAGGPMRYVLIERRTGNVTSGHAFEHHRIPGLPLGAYQVYVSAAGGESFGQTEVEVRSGERTTALVPLRPSPSFSGIVRSQGGRSLRGLLVQACESTWPEPLARIWGQAQVAPDGRFRLFSAGLDRLPVAVRQGDAIVARSILVAGAANEVVLP